MGEDIKTKYPRKGSHSHSHSHSHSQNKAGEVEEAIAEDCIVFRGWDSAVAEDVSESESGVCSPTLWGGSNRNRSLSPASRARAIARGQQELMEMVRAMPESSYELSLKDLVEQQLGHPPRQPPAASEASFKKRTESRAVVTRSRSVDSGGFYLRMFFPLPMAPSFRKKQSLPTHSGSKDREWWRKRSVAAAGEMEGSVSGGSLTSSGSSNSTTSLTTNISRNSESQGSCWFCISPMRSKKTEE